MREPGEDGDGLRDLVEDEPEVEGWPSPLGEAAYYGPLGLLTRLIEPHTEADPAAILCQLLVAYGNSVGPSPFYPVEGSEHRGNEFLVLVGRTSGGRKGTSWDQCRRVMGATDEKWARERVQGGLSSGEGLIQAVHDPVFTRSPVKDRGRTISYEDVESDPGVHDKRLLVYEPEFARVLAVMLREGSILSTILRQAWDGPNLRVMTKTGVTATGAHVSIIGHITTEELLKKLQETEAANGFGNRFLWVAVKRSKLLPDGGSLDPADLVPAIATLREALDATQTITEMRRDASAATLWHHEYPHLTSPTPGLLGAMLGRAEAHVLRLSMLYALTEGLSVISKCHLEAATALWSYSCRSSAFIFGTSLGDPTADDILKALQSTPSGLTRTDIRDLFHRNRSTAEIARALAVLVRLGVAYSTEERCEGAGRPAEVWKLR